MSIRISGNYGNEYPGNVPESSTRAQHGGIPDKSEVCTTNTDRVDAEIKQLRMEKEQLMAQMGRVYGDGKRETELKEKIAQIDVELRLKDNDTYRRQNAVIHSTE